MHAKKNSSNPQLPSRKNKTKTSQIPLQLINNLDLGSTSTTLIKHIPQPLLRQPSSQLQPNNPLAETEHLGVVAQHGALDGEAVVRRHGPYALDLVRRDGDAEARAADQERAVDFALGHELGCGRGPVRVGCLVVCRQAAYVGYGFDAWVGFEVGFDLIFVGYPCFLDVCQFFFLKE